MGVDGLEVINGVFDLLGLAGEFPGLSGQFFHLGFGVLDSLVVAWLGLLQFLELQGPPSGLLALRGCLLLERPGLLGGLGLSRVQVHRPGQFAVASRREQTEEIIEVLEQQRRLLADLDIGHVVIPDLVRRLPLREEQEIRLHTRACRREDTRRQAHDAPQVAIVEQFPLGLDKGVLVRPEQQALVEHDPAPSAIA